MNLHTLELGASSTTNAPQSEAHHDASINMNDTIATVSRHNTISIKLQQWITSAHDECLNSSPGIHFDFDHDPRSLALRSEEYLTSGLKVARALAIQLSTDGTQYPSNGIDAKLVIGDNKYGSLADAWSQTFKGGNTSSNVLASSPSNNNWAEHVSVYVAPRYGASANGKNRTSSFGSNMDINSIGEEDILDALNLFSDNEDDCNGVFEGDENKKDEGVEEEEVNRHGGETDSKKEEQQHRMYLNVQDATLSSSSATNKSDEMQAIYRLGLILYEIFSGGDRPPKTNTTASQIEPHCLLPYRELANFCQGLLDNHQSGTDERLFDLSETDKSYTSVDFGKALSFIHNLDDSSSSVHGNDDITSGAKGVQDKLAPEVEQEHGILEQAERRDSNSESKKKKKQAPTTSFAASLTSNNNASHYLGLVSKLESLGIPIKLCELISNMLDCISGDLRQDESYTHMADVASDLGMMLDQPSRYLYDVDILNKSNGISTNSDPWNETKFGRKHELKILQESYKRSILAGDTELALISGSSGIGKSVLARRLVQCISFTASDGCVGGGIVLHGKFDQLSQPSNPFSALGVAFNSYCEIMSLREKGGEVVEEVSSRLKSALGNELRHLVRVIPNLASFLGSTLDNDYSETQQDCVNGQTRLLYLLCQFVDIIATYSGAPIVIFLDDLQWADPSSITVINQLLMMPSADTKQLFFLGCCRDEGLAKDHPLEMMLSNVRSLGVIVTEVKLECMGEEMIDEIISDTFAISPRLTRPLAGALFHKTKGNPLFFAQLMTSLKKEGMLWLSLERRRWVWDIEKILARAIPVNVAAIFAETIDQLDHEVQTALAVLSCFGARTNCSLLELLEGLLKLQLVGPLDVAVSDGLLDKIDGKYSFSHDRVQESAYKRIKPEEQCLQHFKYGIALAATALETHDDDLLPIAVSQINRGGPKAAAKDENKRVLIANLNLNVGKKAMDKSDFANAYSFFDYGISFLCKGHWQEHYELSFELFELAAKCALVVADYASQELLSLQVIRFGRTFDEQINVMYMKCCALAYSNKLTECIELATSVLARLGEKVTSEVLTEKKIKAMVQQTQTILQGYTDEDLLHEHKMMENKEKIVAMRFYALIEAAAQHAKPDLQPIITLKMVKLSIFHGMCPDSPIAFSYFGMLIARLGNMREGYQFVTMARKLLDRVGSERAGEVIFVGTQIRCFVEPVQATFHAHLEGYNAAMTAGDINSALSNMICYTAGSFEAGISLQIVKENCDKTRRLLEQHNHLFFLIALETIQRSIYGVIGEEMEAKNEKYSQYSSLLDHLNNMYLDLTFRRYDQMKANAEKYYDAVDVKLWALLYSHATHESIAGLASFWIYRESRDKIWFERGHKSKDKYLNWIAADCSKINFESRFFLLEAEEFYSLGIDDPRNLENAKASYIKAIASAKKYRSISDEAYGCELFGYFLLEQKDDTCLGYFVTAQQTFMGWGALKKAAALGDIISKLSGNSTENDTPNSHQTGMVSPLCGEDDLAAKPCGEDNWATLCNILDENRQEKRI